MGSGSSVDPPSQFVRQRLLIDQSVQASLLRRLAFYSLACSLYCMMILVITESMLNPQEAISLTTRRCLDEAVFWAPGMMLLLPIIAYDLLRITTRFAGPIFRLRREMQQLNEGGRAEPLSFLEDDYWHEIAASFNQLRHELLELREFKASQQLAADRNHTNRPAASSQVDATDPVTGSDPKEMLLKLRV